jgi:hypothetical protein
MPRSTVKWGDELKAWIEAKKRDPNLTHEEFYKLRRLKAKTAQKRIGKKMSESWGKVQVLAQSKLEHNMGISLAKELETTFRASKEIFGRAVAQLLPDPSKRTKAGKLPAPELSPRDVTEAARIAKLGLDGILGVAQRLTGGERMIEKPRIQGPDPVFRWTSPQTKPPPPRKKKKRR